MIQLDHHLQQSWPNFKAQDDKSRDFHQSTPSNSPRHKDNPPTSHVENVQSSNNTDSSDDTPSKPGTPHNSDTIHQLTANTPSPKTDDPPPPEPPSNMSTPLSELSEQDDDEQGQTEQAEDSRTTSSGSGERDAEQSRVVGMKSREATVETELGGESQRSSVLDGRDQASSMAQGPSTPTNQQTTVSNGVHSEFTDVPSKIDTVLEINAHLLK